MGLYVEHRESVRYQVISEFCYRRISRSRAAEILGVSLSTVTRWASQVREKGLLGVKHGNYGRTPANKIDGELKAKVVGLIKEQFFDFNMKHTLETLQNEYGIKLSYSTLRRWCHEYGLVKHVKVQRRVIRKPRTRVPREGFVLQMDGSHHQWNGEDEWCLVAAIDDATSEIPYAEFFKAETTLACLKVLKKVIENGRWQTFIFT